MISCKLPQNQEFISHAPSTVGNYMLSYNFYAARKSNTAAQKINTYLLIIIMTFFVIKVIIKYLFIINKLKFSIIESVESDQFTSTIGKYQ